MNRNENRCNSDPETSEPAECCPKEEDGRLERFQAIFSELAFVDTPQITPEPDDLSQVQLPPNRLLGHQGTGEISLKNCYGTHAVGNAMECGTPDSTHRETQMESGAPAPVDGSQKERQPQDGPEESDELFCDSDPTLWLYRDRTAALLRRYFRFSIEVGRLPSLLGREFFRTRVTSYRVGTFEDAVIFVSDVERCLDQLDDEELDLISSIVFEDFTHEEAALLMQCRRRTLGRRLPDALDHLTDLFLESAILLPFPTKFSKWENRCQEAKMTEIPLSDCEQGKNKFPNFDQSP